MELMDLETIILAAIGMSGLFLVGFFFRKQIVLLQHKQELDKKLKEITSVIRLKPSKKEHFSDKLLVLDETNKKVVYLDYYNQKHNTVIDLQDLKECKLHVRRLVVQLELKFDNPYRDACFVVFYQRFIDPEHLRCKLTLKARRWKELLSESIASNREFEYGITG